MSHEFPDAQEMEALTDACRAVANSITPLGSAAGTDATGGSIRSLTEAVMGITAALVQIAAAISELADAVREHGEPT